MNRLIGVVPVFILKFSFLPLSNPQNFHHKSYTNNPTTKMSYPHTAPLASKTTESFTFDPPASPKSARNADSSTSIFTFDGTSTITTTLKYITKSPSKLNKDSKEIAKATHEPPTVTRRASTCERISNIFRDSPNKDKTESKSKKINSAQLFRKNSVAIPCIKDNDSPATAIQTSDLTMFPFDREAIDYERIQRECFAVEEEYDSSYETKYGFPYDYDTEDSPTFEVLQQQKTNPPPIMNSSDANNTSSSDVFHQYTIMSQQENERQHRKQSKSSTNSSSTSSEMKTFSKYEHNNKAITESSTLIQESNSSITSSVPDLKVNLFVDSNRKSSTVSNDSAAGSENKVSVLDACQQNVSMTSSFGCRNASGYTNNNSINLTSNPMETAVCVSPRAVIVVQQVNDIFNYFISLNLIHVFPYRFANV